MLRFAPGLCPVFFDFNDGTGFAYIREIFCTRLQVLFVTYCLIET